MLDYEYELLIERLNAVRGDRTAFFVFADTVAAKSFKGTNEAHGWMGVHGDMMRCALRCATARSLRGNARKVGTASVAGFHPALRRGPLRELEAEAEHPQYLA